MTPILLLDDEPNILAALRRELMARNEFDNRIPDYKIAVQTEPRAALQLCATTRFDLVISDYRMPGLDGVSFLAELRLLQPDCIRIILSGQADMEGLLRAINEVEIYRFLSKPWQAFELRSAVDGALRYHRMQQENASLAHELRQMKK